MLKSSSPTLFATVMSCMILLSTYRFLKQMLVRCLTLFWFRCVRIQKNVQSLNEQFWFYFSHIIFRYYVFTFTLYFVFFIIFYFLISICQTLRDPVKSHLLIQSLCLLKVICTNSFKIDFHCVCVS